MAISTKRQLQFWGAGFALFVLFMWLLGGTLLPFIAGAAIAYLLDPLADRLQRLGMSRTLATAAITLTVVLVFALLILLAVPALISQAQALVEAVPGYIDSASAFLYRRFPTLLNEQSELNQSLEGLQARVSESGLEMLNSVLVSSLQVLDIVIIMLVTPVVAFYLLLDWDGFVAKIDGWLPRRNAGTVRRLAHEIDAALAGFVRGQSAVCLILGGFYALALMLVGLPFGFLIGIVAGLISFIPFVGSFVGGLLSIGIAIVTFWEDPVWIFAVAGIFGFGQFVEGNVLAPNLIGKSVGLHPVVLILALSVFGALFGFAGLLIAVPLAAAMGVLGRFAVEKYLESPLYSGLLPPSSPIVSPSGEVRVDPVEPPAPPAKLLRSGEG
ncbi:MAG: AI-2E family transporter [Rhodobacteraceae bacterium]|nr:AI-2E family transporter [Paracoccaceae bacterium]